MTVDSYEAKANSGQTIVWTCVNF